MRHLSRFLSSTAAVALATALAACDRANPPASGYPAAGEPDAPGRGGPCGDGTVPAPGTACP